MAGWYEQLVINHFQIITIRVSEISEIYLIAKSEKHYEYKNKHLGG
jgi:hypothetical protein